MNFAPVKEEEDENDESFVQRMDDDNLSESVMERAEDDMTSVSESVMQRADDDMTSQSESQMQRIDGESEQSAFKSQLAGNPGNPALPKELRGLGRH